MAYNWIPKIANGEVPFDIADVKAIAEQAHTDYKELYRNTLDETSKVMVHYNGIKLWALCNSTFKSMEVYCKYTDQLQKAITDSYLECEDKEGTEIAIERWNKLELEGKFWNAMYINATAEHKALAELYKELFSEDWTKREMPKYNTGKTPNKKPEITPKLRAWAESKAKEATSIN
tara:strand:- start:295 stop:822 length:528 start_codon:yes stop_codon:yes gene_type:complete